MAGEPPVAAGKLQHAGRVQQRLIHRLQQQHELRQGAPTVCQVVTQGIGTGRMPGKKTKNIVLRRDRAIQPHDVAEGSHQVIRLNQRMSLQQRVAFAAGAGQHLGSAGAITLRKQRNSLFQ